MIDIDFILGPPAHPLERNSFSESKPSVTERDVRLGFINRYFVQKRNELTVFVEISEDSYNSYGDNTGIDPILWKRGTMKWRIKGTPEQIAITNRDTLVLVSVDFPGIQTYFRDLSEYSI